MLIPELQESHRLFAQMDIVQQKVIKFWSRVTPICENVSESGSPTPLGVKFWSPKMRFDPPGHRKTIPITPHPGRRVLTLWCENEVLKESKHSSWTVEDN